MVYSPGEATLPCVKGKTGLGWSRWVFVCGGAGAEGGQNGAGGRPVEDGRNHHNLTNTNERTGTLGKPGWSWWK